MKSRFAGFPVRSLSIRMLVVLWAGSVLLAWAGLVGGWFIAKNRLSKIDQRITLDAEALDAAHELESDVLAERYNDLLWKATGQSMYKQQREEYLRAAEQIAANLSRYITTEREREVSIQIEREMNTLREQSQPSTLAPSQSEPLLASLLSAVRLFDAQNETDVQRSLLAADGLHGQVCTVLGDVDRLERVVQNLVSNAVKYSPPGTQITVRIERKERFALLAVCDQGQGISLEDQKILFQPFGRGRSAERLAEGTGMGLYVVKQIIEAHGGQITVQSQPGRGTTFQIQLPLA